MNEVKTVGPLEKEVMDLKVLYKELDMRVDNNEKEIIVVKSDIKSTNTRVDGLEKTLNEINDNTKWIKRAFIKGGISIAGSLAVAVVIALVAFYFNSLGG